MFFAKVWVDPNATLDVASSNTPITNLMGGSVLGHLGMKVNVARRAAETVVNAVCCPGGVSKAPFLATTRLQVHARLGQSKK